MTESAALFKRCMLDAAAADMKELDAEMTVPTDFSAAHARKMSGILGFRVHSHSIAKRALIILIAAAFLLTGCTVAVYFGTSRNVEVVFRPGGRSIEITFSGPSSARLPDAENMRVIMNTPAIAAVNPLTMNPLQI